MTEKAKAVKKPIEYQNITFTRADVAKILNCTPLTVSNREKKKIYPEPERNASSNFRVYTLIDVLYLQLVTFGKMQINHIYAQMYDRGFTDPAAATHVVNEAIKSLKQHIDTDTKPMPQCILINNDAEPVNLDTILVTQETQGG